MCLLAIAISFLLKDLLVMAVEYVKRSFAAAID